MIDMPTEIETDFEWFKNKLAEKRISQARLAKLLEMDKSSMSLLLRGKRRMTTDRAADIARLLGVSVTEVMKRAGTRLDGLGAGKPMVASVPLAGWLDASGIFHKTPEVVTQIDDCTAPDGSIAVQWRTAQSPAEMLDNWLVVAGPERAPNADLIHDRMCIVRTSDGRSLLRTVRRGYTRDAFNLHAYDAEPEMDVRLEWVRPVIFARPAF